MQLKGEGLSNFIYSLLIIYPTAHIHSIMSLEFSNQYFMSIYSP